MELAATDPTQTFSILAELALGLAGFTGVAAVFGGRDREFELVDHNRLLAIFLAAGSVLAGSLMVLTLGSAETPGSRAVVWGSLAALPILLPNVYPLVPNTFGFWRDPDTRTRGWVFAIVVAQFAASLVLLVGNVLSWRALWPLVAACSIQLLYGLFLFARILTVRR